MTAFTIDLALGRAIVCFNSNFEIFNISLTVNSNSFYKYLAENPSDNVSL
jgi:hypothetical protein